MTLMVVPYYAAFLGLFFILLALAVIQARGRYRVPLGFGGVAELERRIRVHANFAEYVPFALLLLAMAEVRGTSRLALHVLCVCLVAGRLLHAWAVSRMDEDVRIRIAGIALTLTALGGASIALLLSGLWPP